MENKQRAFKRVIPDNVNVIGITSGEIKPLKIKCNSTQCTGDLHCFSRYMKNAEKKFGKKGVCYNCGHESIDWKRVHQNDINDADYIFESLNKELMRKVFSTIKVEKVAVDAATSKSLTEIREDAIETLRKRIGKYNYYIDGRQTPLGENYIVNYAQHATGTCCRKCLEAWHNIPKEQELSKAQLEFCTNLVMLYVENKVPGLKK